MPSLLALLARQNQDGPTIADELRTQWSGPPDVLSILLLLGGDVVQASLAQLTSSPFLTPAVFSFGWVSYAVSALLSAVGDNRLMPASPDYPCLVINGKSGYARDNRSWILSRTLRDFDFWKGKEVSTEEEKLLSILKKKLAAKGKTDVQPRVPLSVSIYNVSAKKRAGKSTPDFIYAFSFLVIAVQFAIAAIPCGLYDDWAILMVTGAGTALAWATAALPQWREEKVGACRKDSDKTFVITSGNGTKDVIVIRGAGVGLDLEDLAAANARTAVTTRVALCVMGVLWVALLITVAGLKSDTWFLLGVGGVGMLQNILVAALPRRPSAYGLHLEYEQTICQEKVMLTLQALEEVQPFLGRSLLQTFFPGEMREDEIKWWEEAKKRTIASKCSPSVVASPPLKESGYVGS
jgi:hypothetical protein